MILRYTIDGLTGNRFVAIINATSREEGDQIARQQTETFKRRGLFFDVHQASVDEITSEAVIWSTATNHETGDTFEGEVD